MSDLFEEFDRFRIPAPKGLDDEGLEGDALTAATLKVETILGGLSSFDGGGGFLGGAKEDVLLRGRSDADVKRHFASVNKVSDVDVSWTGKRAGKKARHFLCGIERG